MVINDCVDFLNWRCLFSGFVLSKFHVEMYLPLYSIERWHLSRDDWSSVPCLYEYTNQCCYGTGFTVAEVSVLFKKWQICLPLSFPSV